MSPARGGIDLGGTKIQAVVVDRESKLLGDARRPTPSAGGPDDVVEALSEAVREASEEAGVDPGDLLGVGVGSPGQVDGAEGTVTSARNLPGWEGSFPLARALSD